MKVVVENLNGAVPLYSSDNRTKPIVLNKNNKLVNAKINSNRFFIPLSKITKKRLTSIVFAINEMEKQKISHCTICIDKDNIGFGSKYCSSSSKKKERNQMLEAKIAIQQIDARRWNLICRALMHLEKENGAPLDMKKIQVKEEDSGLKFFYDNGKK
jgi:hypothetical protein